MSFRARTRVSVLSLALLSAACGGSRPDDFFGTPNGGTGSGDAGTDSPIFHSNVEASTDEAAPDAASSNENDAQMTPDANDVDRGAKDADGGAKDADARGDEADAVVDAIVKVDGGQPDRVGCELGCDKRVFVTSEALPNGGFGRGLTAPADAFCQSAAEHRILGGTWKAWLSNAVDSPATRFTRNVAAYRLLDGTVVAMGWLGLTSGKLQHAIDMTEMKTSVPYDYLMEVWTGTTPSGTASGISCEDWTNSTSDLPYGDVGTVGKIDIAWTQNYRQFCHLPYAHLYCFEQ
jgi:hypothetical protein